MLNEIGSVVPFDAYAWVLTDPVTAVGVSPLADVPCLGELPRLIRLKYLTQLNRWTGLVDPVALLSESTGGDLSRSLLWRELLADYDVIDVASLVFRDTFGIWAFLDLWRRGQHGVFTAAERRYIAAITAPVTAALRRAQARSFVPVERSDGAREPVVLLLSGDLDVRAQTAQTEQYLSALVPPDVDRSPIPAAAYNAGAQLLAVESGVDSNPPMARVHLFGGRWLTVRAARLAARHETGDHSIAVTVEDSSPAERCEVYALAHGLTGRERELLGHLVSGADTRELAELMELSPHTVSDHLKAIFTKTSVHGRGTLLTRALGG